MVLITNIMKNNKMQYNFSREPITDRNAFHLVALCNTLTPAYTAGVFVDLSEKPGLLRAFSISRR